MKAMKNWSRPLTLPDIRSFLCLTGYYRRFVDCFGSIASHLSALVQNSMKFELSEGCEKSFQLLKDRLTSTSVLTLPEGKKCFVVYCHASRVGLGCVIKNMGPATQFTRV